MSYLNRLEPEALVQAFLHHPPQGFTAWQTAEGLPVFAAEFNLLTTMDEDLRQRIERLPLYRFWGRWLRPRTCFVGTTVSEYTLLPADKTSVIDMVAHLKAELAPHYPFLIVKDVPQHSPLLAEKDNELSRELIDACSASGFVSVEGQALAWVPIDFASTEEYLLRFSASRRKDMRRKLKLRSEIIIEAIPTGSACFTEAAVIDAYYALYLNVYAQSSIHFDLLTREFFACVLQDETNGGVVFVYRRAGEIIGFNLCFVAGEALVDKYVGFSYPAARECNLYFLSWFHNLEYAREQGLKRYIAGWTDPEIKLYLGAQFTFTRHMVHIRNPFLRALLRRLSRFFESDRQWQENQDRKVLPT